MNLDFDIESIESVEFRPVQTNPRLPMFNIILTMIFLPIALIFITLGSILINSCSAAPNLPIWMIFLGSFLVVDRGIAWILEVDLFLFQRDNSRPDEEVKALKEWEFHKAGLRLRVSNYTPYTICGLIYL